MGKYFGLSGFGFGVVLILLSAVTAPAGDYVGNETCGMCHPDILESWAETAHAKAEDAIGCESCHGPGSEHVDGGGDASAITKAVDEPTCTACHTADTTPDWNYEEYLKTGVHSK